MFWPGFHHYSANSSASYVEMLEQQQAQLVVGLQELYKRAHGGHGWAGSPLKESSNGNPLTHDILERLGALKQDGQPTGEQFEEDLHLMQQRLIASGVGFMQRQESSDGGSDCAHSPMFDSTSKAPIFTDPFALNNNYPPTPPNHSPFPRASHPLAQIKTQPHSYVQPSPLQPGMNPALLQHQTWPQPAVQFDDNMDFIRRFESPTSFDASMSPPFNQQQLPMSTMNPCLPMRDWNEEDDFKTFFNPTLL